MIWVALRGYFCHGAIDHLDMEEQGSLVFTRCTHVLLVSVVWVHLRGTDALAQHRHTSIACLHGGGGLWQSAQSQGALPGVTYMNPINARPSQ